MTLPTRAVVRRVQNNWEARSPTCAQEAILAVVYLSNSNEVEFCLGDGDEEVRRNYKVRSGLRKTVGMRGCVELRRGRVSL
jgi:hypothetical protein